MPADFILLSGGNDCADSGTVAAGGACTLTLEFSPLILATPGVISENLTLTDNSLNVASAQQLVALSGTALAVPGVATTTTFTLSPNTVFSGGTVTLSATVMDNIYDGNIPTGTVTFTDTLNNTLGSCSLTAGACTTPGKTLHGFGSDIITASYGGAMGFDSSSATSEVAINLNSAVGTPTSSYPVTVTFTAAGTLGSISVLTQGAAGMDFADAGSGTCTLSSSYSIGNTCIVNLIFTPKYPGRRNGAVELLDGSGNVLGMSNISGIGMGPMAGFSPPAQSTLSKLFRDPVGLAIDGSGNIFVADQTNWVVWEMLAADNYATVKNLDYGTFNTPNGVALDGAGNVFVVGGSGLQEILAAGGYTTVKNLRGAATSSSPIPATKR